MTTQEVANQLVDYCRKSQYYEAAMALYAPDCVSVEEEMPGDHHRVQGMEALGAKGKGFEEQFEVHSTEVSDPIVAGDYFSVTMKLNATDRKTGEAAPMEEVAVYKVKDGKVVHEHFFYDMPAQ